MSAGHILDADAGLDSLRHHRRPKDRVIRATPLSNNLDPRSRPAIRGCHCGSLTLASCHARQQINPQLRRQGGRRRRDTPQLTRNGYDLRSLVEQFDAKSAEIRKLLRGDLDAGRSQELMDEMRAAGLPT